MPKLITQTLDYHVTHSAGLPLQLLWAQTRRDFTEVFYLSVIGGTYTT